MNVVVRTSDGVMSLLVDEIGDVVEVEEGLFEPPPGTLPLKSRELISGAFKLPHRLLLKLDTDRAVLATPL
jgi:purine-binding chemotaxis protein CheW